MAYHSVTDILNAIPEETVQQLTDDNGIGVYDPAILAGIMAQTEAEIDSYLSGMYTLPLTAVPSILVAAACDITAYRLYKRRLEIIPDTRRNAYTDALRVLRDIRDGKTKLAGSGSSYSGGDFACGCLETEHATLKPAGLW